MGVPVSYLDRPYNLYDDVARDAADDYRRDPPEFDRPDPSDLCDPPGDPDRESQDDLALAGYYDAET